MCISPLSFEFFGFIGVFLGPTLLAVSFRLVEEWSANSPPALEANDKT